MSVRRHSAERGVSLVETLVALLILSLISLSIITMFTHGMQLNATGADYTALTNIAKSKAEELLALGFDHADLAAAATHTETANNGQLAVSWRVGDHHVDQNLFEMAAVFGADPLVSNLTGGAQANIKAIAVTVASQGLIGLGRREVTVMAIKTVRWEDQVTGARL